MSNDCRPQTTKEETAGPSRREFLSRAGLLASGLAILGLPGIKPQVAAAATTAARAFGSSVSALELDGQFVDYLKSAEGGFPRANVIQEAPGLRKHIEPPTIQDIAIQCDPLMPKPLFDWIAATLTMNPVRKNGAIITADFNHAEQSRLQFNNALISEFGIPTMDAASQDPGYFTIKFAPESTIALGGKGTILPSATKSKIFLPGSFRLSIPGLDCSKVSKIDALAIRQILPPSSPGLKREAGKLDFPNVALYVAEAQAGTFYAWFQDMVIKGNTGDNFEKPGTLEFLDPTLKTSLLTIYLNHLGIFGYSPMKLDSGAGTVRQVKIEMYCEQITLTPIKA
jgi:hypothetical protein